MSRNFFFAIAASLPLLAQETPEIAWEYEGPSVQEFHSSLQEAFTQKHWWTVITYGDFICHHFPSSPFAEETPFLVGEAYLNLNHPLIANDYFSNYLNQSLTPKHFEQAIEYKFEIAERFRQGEKKPLFHSHKAPRWLSGKEDALEIYDEVIACLPHSDLAARSLLSKGAILADLKDFQESLDAFDTLLRKFPKHELAATAYLEKIRVYLSQTEGNSIDPDLLDLAEVSLRKFRLAFPREPRIAEAEALLLQIEEAYAANLLKTGKFFEKTKKIPAAKIYYTKVIAKYPNTEAALVAQEKLISLSPDT